MHRVFHAHPVYPAGFSFFSWHGATAGPWRSSSACTCVRHHPSRPWFFIPSRAASPCSRASSPASRVWDFGVLASWGTRTPTGSGSSPSPAVRSWPAAAGLVLVAFSVVYRGRGGRVQQKARELFDASTRAPHTPLDLHLACAFRPN
jgi:hypothetical protein